ncbi:MAG: substrate-binding domain-containing protein [Ignavibacteria bacterium]|nr:substrate-binding domain-containing protein [Ignavibacteria bacterium]
MAVKWADEYKKTHPEIQIHISAGGAGKGMTDALSGMVDLGMVSRSISKEETDKGAWYIASSKGCCPSHHKFRKSCIKRSSDQGIKKK